ncbi:ATP-dependent DNA helicase RecG [Halovulum sp. GXIMD14793]
MSTRPHILFPLFGDLAKLPGIGPKTAEALVKAGIEKPLDLLTTLPHSVIDRRPRHTINGAPLPAVVTLEVEIGLHQPPKARGRPYRVMVRDAETEFQLVFFHAREDWLRKQLPAGQRRVVSGKAELFDGLAQMVHPDHILSVAEADTLPEFEPVYPLTAGVTQKVMTKAIGAVLDDLPDLEEWIEPSILKREKWHDWQTCLRQAHNPRGMAEVSANSPARLRLAYDEFLAHQMTLALARAQEKKRIGRPTVGDGSLRQAVLDALPFSPTDAQTRSVQEIITDMASDQRMHRLLQGDVGAGKTLVALMAMLNAVEAGGQAAMMAPTEILARQHYAGLQPLADTAGVRIELLTGRDTGAERAAKLARIADGTAQLVVGTHALFSDDVAFADLRLGIVDEQHRFGVRQRLGLSAKGARVDVLVMTATPIPRSLELAHYGDLDLSVLDEKPPGRQPIETVMVSSDRLSQVVDRLGKAIAAGRQAYWVCPLVEESEVVAMAAAEERFKALRAALGEEAVGLVHGQMPPSQKDAAMADFAAGRTKLLVATTVIEVGVDVPNASIMVIEAAQHFGLAQLHQLRGRVGRGTEKSTCMLLYDPPLGETARARLEVMRETEDGFRIAETDLKLRGAGDVLGVQQSGLPRFRVADLENQAGLMQVAQDDARLLLSRDANLKTERGDALRQLLFLMEQDKAIRLLSAG